MLLNEGIFGIIQIYPSHKEAPPNDVQERLVKKLGGNAYPFSVGLPELAPASVVLQSTDTVSYKSIAINH